jgi:probable HAF family extracellular repeat protein
MKKISTLHLAILAVAVATTALFTPFAYGQIRLLTTIDPPNSIDTRAFGINNMGQIVGLYITADNRSHGFLLSHGAYTTIDVPGSIRTNALAINVHGQIVGRYDTPDKRAHGYVLSNGAFTTIDVPGAAGFTTVTDITPSGQMVGRYLGSDGRFHGFSLIDGNFTTIDDPDGIGIQGMAVNRERVIAGYYVDATGRFHGFLLDDGSYTTFDPPGSIGTGSANGVLKINSAGDVVGYYTRVGDAVGAGHGFLYTDGEFITFDFPDAQFTCNLGINRQGDIVGLYVDQMNRRHGFLAPRGTEEQVLDSIEFEHQSENQVDSRSATMEFLEDKDEN